MIQVPKKYQHPPNTIHRHAYSQWMWISTTDNWIKGWQPLTNRNRPGTHNWAMVFSCWLNMNNSIENHFQTKTWTLSKPQKWPNIPVFLSNMSDYWFFSSLSFSLASFLSSFREELLGYPNTKLLMFPKRIQSKENLHFLKTSSSFWKYFLSFKSLIDIDLLFVTLNVTEEKSLRLTWLFLLLWKFTFLLVSKLKILFFVVVALKN